MRQPSIRRYTMTKGSRGDPLDPLGRFRIVGEAEVIERQTPDGADLAWLVVSGDTRNARRVRARTGFSVERVEREAPSSHVSVAVTLMRLKH